MAMSFCSLFWPTLYIFLFFLDGTFCAIKQQRKLLRLSTSSEKLLELPNPYPRAMLQNTCETSAGVYSSSVGPMGQQCQMHHQQVESVQRNAAHFTCRDYRRTSSVTKCCRSCSGIHTSSQEVAISILDQKVCNSGTYRLFPSAIWLWTHTASRHLPATFWQFQDPSQQFPFHLSTGLRPCFYQLNCTVFYPKLLFIVYWCSAFSIHICLFTRGAILLEIESAPWSEDEACNLQQSGGWGDGASSVFYRRKFSFGKIPFLGGVAQW